MPQNKNANVLVAAVHDVRPFVTLLRAVNFNATAAIVISSAGLTIAVEDAKMLVAKAYAPCEMFDEYDYSPRNEDALSAEEPDDNDEEPSLIFHIHLDTVLECLNIFGTGSATLLYGNNDNKRRKKQWAGLSDDSNEEQPNGVRKEKKVAPPKGNTTLDQFFFSGEGKKTGMRMTYAGQGHPLVLILGEDAAGPITTCEIETIEEDGVTELAFDDSLNSPSSWIKQSSWLSDSLLELDPSCEKLTFLGIPATEKSKATLRITAEGTFGSTQMDYPYDRDVLETFECAQFVKFTYRVAHIASALKAMQTSLKTSLRIDPDGLLSLQFMMATGLGIFIEFRCLPLVEE
ncbi:hypothetical protein Clacol_006196 [Clathrus columnatus]|uniref:Rad1-domain-containing protein n=1 Tax=Clathrus columnatus TaxID=1419009 RepID=A0AAV5AEL9_9AGAM|nr:hypothetical protein Clacol_006196 [Clathrus columnatus]